MLPFEQALKQSWPPQDWQDRTVLLAVSGGADSVALLRGMHRLRHAGVGKLVVAHFNHAVRGKASDADARFVARLSEQLQLPVQMGHRNPSVGASHQASEQQLRNERLQFLQQAAERCGARYVVTAHTADDRAETILHRILRGTGIAGLSGIRRTRPLGEAVMLLRPMLAISRADVLAYLHALHQPFCQDASNRSLNYTRNRIRHELLPLLADDYNPRIIEAMLRLGRLAEDAQAIVDAAVEALAEQCVSVTSTTEVRIDCQRIAAMAEPLIRELLVSVWRRQGWPLADMGYAEWKRLTQVARQDASLAIDLPGPVRAQKQGAHLLLTRSSR